MRKNTGGRIEKCTRTPGLALFSDDTHVQARLKDATARLWTSLYVSAFQRLACLIA